MKGVMYANFGCGMLPNAHSVAIRVAYMLMDRVVVAGSGTDHIHFDEVYANLSPAQQATVIEMFFEKSGEPIKEAGIVKQQLKRLGSLKHKTRQQIIEEKTLQKMLQKVFEGVLDEMRESHSGYGLHALRELVDMDVLCTYHMKGTDLEFEAELCVPASKLLTFDIPGQHPGNEFICLGPEFLGGLYKDKPTVYGINDNQAADLSQTWMHTCFVFPNVNLFSAVELAAIRKNLQDAGSEFRKQTDAWTSLAATGTGEESIAFFKNKVLPHAASLQAAIAKNEWIQRCYGTQRVESKLEVWMGEIPWEQIWKFYFSIGAIHDPSFQKLQAAKEKNPRFAGRVPVTILHIPVGSDEPLIETKKIKPEVTEIAPVRKSISVD